ncbi:Gfo/Idh/MocA family oxidoreductase [Halobium salinum]|uniref:Gfo/Idh/MocA family oxidoreductase n=1 Tax=Halobium salinum TaxID=1364940 RepID=A0ABD5PAA3_9EURY|nr:Gfo/Idh/MocA family oxidoreductase [Halobium salinum]
MSEATVKAGVIGVGRMGRNHARVYGELAGVELVGVSDKDREAAASVAEEFDTESLEAEDLLSVADVVTVAVPTQFHAPLVRSCIEAGVDVLVEKPFVDDPEVGRELVREAEEAGVMIQVGHIERFNPAVQGLTDLSPDLGIKAVDAQRLGPPIDRQIDDSVVLDLMIHDIDILLSLVDSELDFVAATGTHDGQHATALLRFENGVIGRLTASRITQKKVRTMNVTAEDCLVDVDYTNQSLEIHRSSFPEYVEKENEMRYRHESVVETPMVESGEPLKRELRAFVDAATGDRQPVVTAEDAIRALEVAIRIDEAVKATSQPSPELDDVEGMEEVAEW